MQVRARSRHWLHRWRGCRFLLWWRLLRLRLLPLLLRRSQLGGPGAAHPRLLSLRYQLLGCSLGCCRSGRLSRCRRRRWGAHAKQLHQALQRVGQRAWRPGLCNSCRRCCHLRLRLLRLRGGCFVLLLILLQLLQRCQLKQALHR